MRQVTVTNSIRTIVMRGAFVCSLAIAMILCFAAGTSYAATYYYQGGAYTTASNWNTNPSGGGTAASTFTNAADIWVLRATITLSSNWTVTGQLQIGDGTSSNTVTLDRNSMILNAVTVRNAATLVITTNPSSGTFTVSNGGTLVLNDASTATDPGLASVQGATSTINFGNSSSHVMPAITYGNLVYSSSSNSGQFASGTIAIQGNYSQTAGQVVVNTTFFGTTTVNIDGDFSLTGSGGFVLTNNLLASTNINVNGTTTMNATSSTMLNFQSSTAFLGASVFQANGDVFISGGGSKQIEWGAGSISNNMFGVKGNLTISGTQVINTQSNSTAAKGFVFNGTGNVQVFSNTNSAAVASTECSYQVNAGAYVRLASNVALGTGTTVHSDFTVLSGGTLDCSTYAISGGSTGGGGVQMSAGSTFITAHTGGVASSAAATGSAFSSDASYIFNGTAAQTTSTKLPAAITSAGSVTTSNAAGVTLSQATSFASGATLNLQNGPFAIGSGLAMSSGSNVVRDNGTLSATPATYSGINLTYADLGTTALAVTIGNEFPAAFTGSVTVNKSGATITLNGTKALNGTMTLTSGTLDASANNYNMSLTGNWTNNADAAVFNPRNGGVLMNGTAAQTIGGTANTDFYTLTINNAAGVTLGRTLTFTSGETLNLQNGAFSIGTNLAMSSGSNVVRDNGTLSTTPATYSGINLTYANLGTNTLAVTPGNEFPASLTGNVIMNKTGATVTLNGAKALNGSLTLSAGTLDVSASSYAFSLTGNWTNNASTTAFTQRSGTVTLNGTSAQAIGGSGITSFYNLTNSNTSAPASVNGNINVSNTLNMNGAGSGLSPAATVVINSAAAAGTVSGNGTLQVTRVTTGTADYVNQYRFITNTLTSMTVDYAGAGAQTVNNTVGNYGTLKTSNSGTATLAGAITVNTGIEIGSGTTLDVSASNYQITDAGIWTNNGTFNARSGTVLFNATATGRILNGSMTGASKFNNLTFNGAGGAWSFGANAAEVGSAFTITAGTVTAPSSTLTVTGNWNNSGTFTANSGTVVMNATTTGKILSGTMTGASKFNALTFNGTGGAWIFAAAADVGDNFTISAGNVTAPATLQVAGNWSNSGTFTHNNGVVVFNKSGTQNISGTTAFHDLTVSTGSTTTVSTAGQTVRDILLSNGTMNAGGNITLLSTSERSALISGSGSGSVLGNVIMQRYLDSSFGYRYISSPFQAATVGQLSGYINLSESFPNFYRYNENLTYSGWEKDTVRTDVLTPMRGYTANFGTSRSPSTFALNGVVTNGAISSTLYNHNYTYTKGYNLVGNPYPSPINWTAASGWTKTNIDNAIYYFNAGDTNRYYGTYSSYVAGVSSDGVASNIIPSMQGFFVHVSNGAYPVTGTLTATNAVRTTTINPYYHKPTASDKPLVRIAAAYANNMTLADPAVVYFDEAAHNEFNSELDALKLMNTDPGVPNLYAISPDGNELSIRSLPLANVDSLTVIPLGLQTEVDGQVVFNIRSVENIPAGRHTWLYDAQTGDSKDLRAEPEYRVQLGAGKYDNRFFLMITDKDKVAIPGMNDGLAAYSAGHDLFVYLIYGKGDLVITNMAGQTVSRQELNGTGYHRVTLNVPTGIYIATLYSSIGEQNRKIFIGNQ